MAGDWIKMSVNLPDKPEVWHIAGALGIDADSVVEKLLRVWAWFDAHTENGNAVGVSYSLVDRVAGVNGFAEAMALSGWLLQNGSVLSCPNFDRHNGKTAKNRALTNERVAKHRKSNDDSNVHGNDDAVTESVTKTVTREEKRRESITPRKARLPDDFAPNETGMAKARDCGINVEIELEKFRDYHASKGTAMLDWQAAWRTWIGNAVSFGKAKPANADPYGLRSAV